MLAATWFIAIARPPAAPWWQSSSFLGVISTIAAVLTVVAAIWAALYASRPRRALAYSAEMQRPLGTQQDTWVNKAVPNTDERPDAFVKVQDRIARCL
jgi:hypothetical protein